MLDLGRCGTERGQTKPESADKRSESGGDALPSPVPPAKLCFSESRHKPTSNAGALFPRNPTRRSAVSAASAGLQRSCKAEATGAFSKTPRPVFEQRWGGRVRLFPAWRSSRVTAQTRRPSGLRSRASPWQRAAADPGVLSPAANGVSYPWLPKGGGR